MNNRPMLKVVFLAFALCVSMLPVLAFAQTELQATVTSKVTDLKNIVLAVGGIVIAIGVAIGGIKMALGHPDAWGYAWKVLLGGVIVASSSQIISWLGIR